MLDSDRRYRMIIIRILVVAGVYGVNIIDFVVDSAFGYIQKGQVPLYLTLSCFTIILD